ERGHDLATGLPHLTQRHEPALRWRHAEFLGEFRRAAASGPSSLPYSPFGTVQAPASRRAQNGPPMWPSNTWGTSSTTRYSSIPALRRGAMAVLPSLVSSPRPSSARRRLVDFVTPPGHAHPTGRRRTVHSPAPPRAGGSIAGTNTPDPAASRPEPL